MTTRTQNVPLIAKRRNHAQIVKLFVKVVIAYAEMASALTQMENVSKCQPSANDATPTKIIFFTAVVSAFRRCARKLVVNATAKKATTPKAKCVNLKIKI
jgi:hypothetical protein